MAQHYARVFLRDVRSLLKTMKSFDRSDIDSSTKLEISRTLHSVKSGAAFLGWFDLEEQAHGLEDVISQSGFGVHDWTAAARTLESLVDAHELQLSEQLPEDAGSHLVRFTELEKRVLEESKKRGESFYRLSCRIDRSEPLPYPRAYLLTNNLEKNMTLIKTEPPIAQAEADFSRISFWFTTELSEDRIFNAANVDLVEVLELVNLEYSDVIDAQGVLVDNSSSAEADENNTLSIDHKMYAETLQIAEELAWRLEGRTGSPEAALSSELRRSLESLAFSPVEPLLDEIGQAVKHLAARRGLKARFEYHTASMGLDAGVLESLGEILRQLVRNSLRHGIESPEQRERSGKDAEALLYLDIERSESSYRFTFSDDGRGIDEEAVFEKAQREQIDTDSRNLLDILCIPGFSTSSEADVDGGRGLGLEMMRHLVRSEYNSSLELANVPGKGLALSWTLPEKLMRKPYLVFLSDGRSWAIPSLCVLQRGAMDPDKVDAGGQAYRLGGRLLPIVGPMGLRPPGILKDYVLEIQHRGRRAALIVDDLLSEEPWGPDDLVPADPVGPWSRSLADSRDGVPILTPALVYAADAAPTDA